MSSLQKLRVLKKVIEVIMLSENMYFFFLRMKICIIFFNCLLYMNEFNVFFKRINEFNVDFSYSKTIDSFNKEYKWKKVMNTSGNL